MTHTRQDLTPCWRAVDYVMATSGRDRILAREAEEFAMQKRTLFLVMVIFAAIASTGCAVRAVKSTETGDPEAEKRVLIATQRSEFKEAVVSRVVEDLKRDLCYVKVIDLKKLEGEPAESFDAVVVVNTCKAWRLSRGASRSVKKFPDKDRVVLSHLSSRHVQQIG